MTSGAKDPKDMYRRVEVCPTPLPVGSRSLFNFVNPARWEKETDEAIADHITAVRDQCHAIDPWPCLSTFAFISPRIRKGLADGMYEAVLSNFRQAVAASPGSDAGNGPLFLDFGAGLGQEARAVVQDGVPSSLVFGSDFLPEFLQAGLDLWGDGAPHADGEQPLATLPGLPTSGISWVSCDVFDPASIDALLARAKARGRDGFHTIFLGSVLHCFNLERQRVAVRALSRLLSSAPGATIFGRHGAIPAGMAPGLREGPEGMTREEFQGLYWHDEVSFQSELWEWETAQRREADGPEAPDWDVFVHIRGTEVRENIQSKEQAKTGTDRIMSFTARRVDAQ